jgi:hypothetical protein
MFKQFNHPYKLEKGQVQRTFDLHTEQVLKTTSVLLK